MKSDPGDISNCWKIWLPVWKYRDLCAGWFIPVVLVSIILLFVGGGYEILAHYNAWRGITVWDPYLAIDFIIPVIPWSILTYITHYLYFPAIVLSAPRTDIGRCELLIVHQGLLILTVFSFVMFVVFPCDIYIRNQLPESLMSYTGWPGTIYGIVHSLDSPYNAWPSLHVSLSLLCVLYLQTVWSSTLARRLLWLAWVALVISTMTTKQHFFFDVMTGTLSALIVWYGLVENKLNKQKISDSQMTNLA